MKLFVGKKKLFNNQIVISLVIEMLLLYYLPTYVAWLFLLFLAFFDGMCYKKDYDMSFKISIISILLGSVVGGFYLIVGDTSIWPYFRDIIRMSLLPLTIIWTKKKVHIMGRRIYTAIYAFVGICIFVGFIRIVVKNSQMSIMYESVRDFRQDSFISEYILALGVFLFIYRRKIVEKNYISRPIDCIIGVLSVLGIGMSFSRTTILLLICLIIFQMKDIKHVLEIGGVLAVTALGVMMLDSTLWEDFIGKLLRSFTELSQSNVWTSTNIVRNWRGYETYCARLQYAEASIIEKIIGIGYGRGIDGRGFAYLVVNEEKIPWLHNGYYTTLIKQGVTGIVMVVFFWIRNLHVSKYIREAFFKRFYLGLVVGLMASMVIAGGVFWGSVPFVYFLIIAELVSRGD